jgi:hypothetical protein
MIGFLTRSLTRRHSQPARSSRRRWYLWPEAPSLERRVLPSNVSVLQYRNDDGNTGQNLAETVLTPGNVNPTDFGKLQSDPVDGYVYAQPLYMANLAIPGQGTHNVVFVATEHDSVYAFDADGTASTGATPLWHDSFIDPAAGITTLSQSDVFGAGAIVPEIGITATPVIDQALGAIYVETATKDIENGVKHIVQALYALNVATGAEMFGGPVVIADTTVNADGTYTFNSGPSVAGTGAGSTGSVVYFNAVTQLERSALNLNNGVVYLSFTSHGDTPPNHGWILGYNAQTLQPAAVFNATPNGSDGTIWGSGEGLAVDAQGDMYFVTGNGTFDTTLDPATHLPVDGDYGESVVKIAVDPTSSPADPNINGWGLKVLDYFTPSNQAALSNKDLDLGSGGPLLLPATATGPPVVIVAGKEGTLYVVDANTGAMGEFSPTQDNVYQEIHGQLAGVFGSPAYWNGYVYFGPESEAIKAFRLGANNTLSAVPTSTTPESFGYPGPNTATSSLGSSNGILWAIDATAAGGQDPAVLRAYDATNLGHELYNSALKPNRDQAGGAVKFTVPTIANGMVFVGGEYALTVYGLLRPAVPPPPAALVATTEPPAFVAPGRAFGLTITVEDGSGRPDTAYGGSVTIALASGPAGASLGGNLTVTAARGVATFAGLTLNKLGTGYRFEAFAGPLSTTLPDAVTVADPPTVVRAQVLFGGTRRDLLVAGFRLTFSAALKPTPAQTVSNYAVTHTVVRHRKIVTQPVAFKAVYRAARDAVILRLLRPRAFNRGGEIVVNASPPHGIADIEGEYLDGTGQGISGVDGVFLIGPKGRSITAQ